MKSHAPRRHVQQMPLGVSSPAQSTPHSNAAALQDVSAGGVEASYLGQLDGPFSEEVNGLLGGCFGESLAGLDAHWSSEVDEVGANATTEGSKMTFDPSIRQDVGDAFSMEVIAHEVAHALAGGGSGQTELDEAGDPGEATAYREGRRFADFTRAGGQAPSLSAAKGGRARIHRHNTGEHLDGVDNAADRAEGVADPAHVAAARPLLEQKIKLANQEELTPGQVSMLMGDYFGVLNKQEDGSYALHPMASWEQLNHCPAAELKTLLDLIADGAGAEPLNDATGGRYMQLSLHNDAHFATESGVGTDNSLGTYEAFHSMAMQAKAGETPGGMDTALGLEACAMHFMQDRHAPGHMMDKPDVMEAAGSHLALTEIGPNMHVKHAHDEVNHEGVEMQNGLGESWRAYGDGMWADPKNAHAREMHAKSVVASYAQLAGVEQLADIHDFSEDAIRPSLTLPIFDPELAERAVDTSAEVDCRDVKLDTLKYILHGE